MSKLGFKFPTEIRKTFLTDLEENWYQPLLAKRLEVELSPTKRSNFGQYNMAVNYLTSVLEEAQAINKVAVYNIDHMAQLRFTGKDVPMLLDRALAGSISSMKIGQCKYTLLLNEAGGVQDDLIAMRISETEYILVINAGHDITDRAIDHGVEQDLIADIDRIMSQKLDGEDVTAVDISDQLVKVDIQGPLSYKLIKGIFGAEVLKNRSNPEKNMNFFSFNEFDRNGAHYFISRTGYTNRWGWELYLPIANAEADFVAIVNSALELGGLLVGLGGRDENRISAGAFGLPLMGQEYDPAHTPINAPLFEAAVDMTKADFLGKAALAASIAKGVTKKMVVIITEGIATGRAVYQNGVRIGSVTSSINSPNVSFEKRQAIGSKRKNVNEESGTCAIGIAWLYNNPFGVDSDGNDIVGDEANPVRIHIELYRENEAGEPTGSPLVGYITAEGISPATAGKPLKQIENL